MPANDCEANVPVIRAKKTTDNVLIKPANREAHKPIIKMRQSVRSAKRNYILFKKVGELS